MTTTLTSRQRYAQTTIGYNGFMLILFQHYLQKRGVLKGRRLANTKVPKRYRTGAGGVRR